ncbi:MAG: nucleotidyltransferase domain-containing protein [Smithellaceae bacterium]
MAKHLSPVEVFAFGSRVSGKAKPYSDLDLVVKEKNRIPINTLARLKEDFEESDIPFRVEILDWNGISRELQNIIKKQCEAI